MKKKKKIFFIALAVFLVVMGTLIFLQARRNARTVVNNDAGFIASVKVERKKTGEDTIININNFWFKSSVIYGLDIGSFKDTDKNGTGDLKGLILQLEYLQSLGADAILLSPFQPTVIGKDSSRVIDLYKINSRLGSMADFSRLIREVNKRGLRIVMDLAVNRSSQPGINLQNDSVVTELIRTVNFWLDKGVAGFGLDSVPALIGGVEGNGEGAESLYAPLTELRHVIMAKRQDGVILGAANDAPDVAGQYFGKNGNGLHVGFNFYVHQYLLYALVSGEVNRLADALQATSNIPLQSQWAVFLRPRDSLVLDRLNVRERNKVLQALTTDSSLSFLNDSIRSRSTDTLHLARRRQELAYSMLLALPCTPIIFSGDESGMVDWFSRMIHVRKSLPGQGRGAWQIIPSGSRHVLAMRYEWEGQSFLTFHNFSERAQEVKIRPDDKTYTLNNLLKPEEVYISGGSPYSYNLEGYGYRWYSIR